MAMLINSDLLIKVEDGTYPVTVAQFRKLHKEWLLGDEVDEEIVNLNGYFYVEPVDKPQGDVVIEGIPVNSGNRYIQTWSVREFTPEEVEGNLATAKEVARSYVAEASTWTREHGAPYDFGGTYGVQHIQLRPIDITNMTGLGLKCDRDPELEHFFRSYENEVIPLSGPETKLVTDHTFTAFTNFMKASWTVQEQIKAATTVAEIPTRDQIRQVLNDSVK